MNYGRKGGARGYTSTQSPFLNQLHVLPPSLPPWGPDKPLKYSQSITKYNKRCEKKQDQKELWM